jgi:2-(1,2-epoxy-1,2-dihydrophenyl)acetyl-CoA isomerase
MMFVYDIQINNIKGDIMGNSFIKTDKTGKVLVLTMHDPETRNAIGMDMMEELNEELDKFESDPNLRALVLTGSDPSFCSGANVKVMGKENEEIEKTPIPSDRTPWDVMTEEWENQSNIKGRPRDLIEGVRFTPLRIHQLQKPSIAAVNGSAIGLGMGIALSCDIRYASENAKFSEMFVRRGLIPADGSCWQLPRMIGLANTFLLQYTGDVLDADASLKLGIVNKVVAHNEILNQTLELANRIANGATYSMALTKKLIHESLYIDLEKSLMLAGPAQDLARRTEDHKEGIKSFVEKRTPNFIGR